MKTLLPVLMLVVLFSSSVALANTQTPPTPKQPEPKPHDIYLTGNRVCKACTWKLVEPDLVELSNKKGVRAVYQRTEIVGADTEPVKRKLFMKMIHGVGLPGRIIVPEAFTDEKRMNY